MYIVKEFWEGYQQKTSEKLKIMDFYIVFCLSLFIVQCIYLALVGNFPMNSLLSGLAITLGAAVITGNLSFLLFYYLINSLLLFILLF